MFLHLYPNLQALRKIITQLFPSLPAPQISAACTNCLQVLNIIKISKERLALREPARKVYSLKPLIKQGAIILTKAPTASLKAKLTQKHFGLINRWPSSADDYGEQLTFMLILSC
jgi:hypothetical protein